MPDYYQIVIDDNRLQSQESSSCVAHTIEDSVDVLEVLPDKAPDPRVPHDGLVSPVGALVNRLRPPEGYVVDIQHSVVRNFLLEDVCHIIVEDGDRVRPTHRQCRESMHSKGCLEGGQVSRTLCELTFVVPHVEVEDSNACVACESLDEMLGNRWDSQMLNGDGIQGLQAMYDARLPVLLRDREPL